MDVCDSIISQKSVIVKTKSKKKGVISIKTTNFGKAVKHRLIDMDLTQNWLIEEVRRKTGLFFDSSYLQKILNGTCNSPKIIEAISEILQINDGISEDRKIG